jgi:glycosyltransferase involved in cell wall biosynthesis
VKQPKPFISIIVAAYNAGGFIEETLISLLNQTFHNYEIIVVDDGSTDDTQEKMNRYADRIVIIRQSNQGQEFAMNTGIKRAQGEYVVSFDADDILFPHALEIYARIIEKFNRPPLILAKMNYFGTNTPIKQHGWDSKTVRCTESSCFFKKRDPIGISNSNIVARRNVLAKVNGYQLNSFYNDRCLLFRLGIESPFLTIDYPITVAHREHDASISKKLNLLVHGAVVICSSERCELYPGGRAMRMDRRGLIATNLASNIRRLIPHLTGFSVWQKSGAILRILLSARLFFFSGIIRFVRKRNYPRKEHEFTVNRDVITDLEL